VTPQRYTREGIFIGETVTMSDEAWDTNLPDCQERVSARVLRYLANQCAAGVPVKFPSGYAGHSLHGTVYMAIDAAGCKDEGERRQVAASILMGLAEEGGFDL
jgi:hypothetical protein